MRIKIKPRILLKNCFVDCDAKYNDIDVTPPADSLTNGECDDDSLDFIVEKIDDTESEKSPSYNAEFEILSNNSSDEEFCTKWAEEYLEDSDSSLWNLDSKNFKFLKEENGEPNQEEDETKTKVFSKKICRKNVKKRYHHKIGYQCEYCSMKFVKLKQLNDHKSTHHSDVILTCVECKKTFKSPRNLRQHRVLHINKVKDFVCEQCGASFIEKRRLNLHKLIHLEEKPIKCEICNKTFSHRSNYTRHLVFHSGVRPFACECGRKFSNSTKLKNHRKLHTNEKFTKIITIEIDEETEKLQD